MKPQVLENMGFGGVYEYYSYNQASFGDKHKMGFSGLNQNAIFFAKETSFCKIKNLKPNGVGIY